VLCFVGLFKRLCYIVWSRRRLDSAASVWCSQASLARCVYLPPLPSALDRLLPAARSCWLRVYDDEGPQHPHTNVFLKTFAHRPSSSAATATNSLRPFFVHTHRAVLPRVKSRCESRVSVCVCVHTYSQSTSQDEIYRPEPGPGRATAIFFLSSNKALLGPCC